MSYKGAYGLQAAGQGLQQTGSDIGRMLMNVAAGQREREYAAEDQRRYDQEFTMRQTEIKARGEQMKWEREQAEAAQRAADAARQDEIERSKERMRLDALGQAEILRSSEGYPNASVLYDTGTPAIDAAGQAIMEAASGLPYVTPGRYDPGSDPAVQSQQAMGDYYLSKGFGVRGQEPPTSGPPPVLTEDIKRRLVESAVAQMGGDYSKLPEVLQTLAERGAPIEYGNYLRDYFRGTTAGGSGFVPTFDGSR